MHFARDEKTKSSESCSPAVRGGVAVVDETMCSSK